MCRLLCVRSDRPFAIALYLRPFAEVARNSREYQGHGWGFAAARNGAWRFYHNLRSIWEDHDNMAGTATLLLAHARSAFQNTGLTVLNNMPFRHDPYVYIFNGELRGVRIREEGRIGAEKLFNFIRRFDSGSMLDALRLGMARLEQRTAYIKAANLVIAEGEKICVASRFSEDPDYYTLRRKTENGTAIICSETFGDPSGWSDIPQGIFEVA
jgi:glutamine amidotransferase